MTTNKTTFGLVVDNSIRAQLIEKITVRAMGPSEHADYIGKLMMEYSSITKNDQTHKEDGSKFVFAMDERGLLTNKAIGLNGFFANEVEMLRVDTFKTRVFELDTNGKMKSRYLYGCEKAVEWDSMATSLAARHHGIRMPVLRKHFMDDVVITWCGDFRSFAMAWHRWCGQNLSTASYQWLLVNMEKGFKCLSASIIEGTNIPDGEMAIFVGDSMGIAFDGAYTISEKSPFALHNQLPLGRSHQGRFHPYANKKSVDLSYGKGCGHVLTSEHNEATLDWLLTNPKTASIITKSEREWVRKNIDKVVITTTDVAKRCPVGVYGLAKFYLNNAGDHVESTEAVIGVQPRTRNWTFSNISEFGVSTHSLVNEVVHKQRRALSVMKWCVNNWHIDSDRARIAMLRLAVRSEGLDEDTLLSKFDAKQTSSADEAKMRLLDPQCDTLAKANHEGKLLALMQTVIRRFGSVKRKDVYRAYACPPVLVKIVSGIELKEGEVFANLGSNVKTKDGYVFVDRNPILSNALTPYKHVVIPNCYLRSISIAAYGGDIGMQILHNGDWDGDKLLIESGDMMAINFEKCVAHVKKFVADTVAWLDAGSEMDKLPCVRVTDSNGKKSIALFNPCKLNPALKKSELARAAFAMFYAMIDVADAKATIAALSRGKMLTWDEVVVVQKVIEAVKHSGADALFVDIDNILNDGRCAGLSAFFAMKSKSDKAIAQACRVVEKINEDGIGEIYCAASPWIAVAAEWCEFAACMSDSMPISGSAFYPNWKPWKHDKILAWLLGDQRFAVLADADCNGKNYCNTGATRLAAPYYDAKQARAAEMGQSTENHYQMSAKKLAARMELTRSKAEVKIRIRKFAEKLVELNSNGYQISAPTDVIENGYSNVKFSDHDITMIRDLLLAGGMDFDNAAAKKYFFSLKRKMAYYYKELNTLIRSAGTTERAMFIFADFLFRLGHQKDANGLPMKEYLFFIGDAVTVHLRMQYGKSGRLVEYMDVVEEADLKKARYSRQ